MTRCFIGLGSNLQQPLEQLARAVAALEQLPGCSGVAVSPGYRNPAIGPGTQPDYINAVAAIDTELSAPALLSALQEIEYRQGRQRGERWQARTLDLDLLLYGDQRIDHPALQVPHPRMLTRPFVLYPLFDLAPALHFPDGSSLRQHLADCPDTGLHRLAQVPWTITTSGDAL